MFKIITFIDNAISLAVCTAIGGALTFSAVTTATEVAATTTVKSVTTNNADIKQSLKALLAKVEYFSADFEQKVFDEESNLLQQTSGKIKVSKPDLVYWHTDEPNESLIVSDGHTLWFYDPFIEQASAYSVNQSVANTPILLLSNNNDELWQHYHVVKNKENHYLIHAKDENSKVKTLALYFTNDVNKQLRAFDIIDATGQTSKISLKNVDATTLINKQTFTFELPAGADLDDQR